MPHIHRLDPQEHTAFLNEDRSDPITGEYLQAGDEVVICAACGSAFLHDSWSYIGEKHCGQRRTLRQLPTYALLHVAPDELGTLLYPAQAPVLDKEEVSLPLSFRGRIAVLLGLGALIYGAALAGWPEVLMLLLTGTFLLLGSFFYRKISLPNRQQRNAAFYEHGIRLSPSQKQPEPVMLPYEAIKAMELRITAGQRVMILKVVPRTGAVIWRSLPKSFEARNLAETFMQISERVSTKIYAQDFSEYQYLRKRVAELGATTQVQKL